MRDVILPKSQTGSVRYTEIAWPKVPLATTTTALRALELAGMVLSMPVLPKICWVREHPAGEIEHPGDKAGWVWSNDPGTVYIRADRGPAVSGPAVIHECRHAWQFTTGNYHAPTIEFDAEWFTDLWCGKTVVAMPKPPEVVIENCAGLRIVDGVIVGLAEVYRHPFDSVGHHKLFYPGCFGNSLSEGGIRALWADDPGEVLGRVYAGTLRITEEELGLIVSVAPPDAPLTRVIAHGIRNKDVDQIRLNFTVLREHWGTDEKGQRRRYILEARLNHVSLSNSARIKRL